MINLDRRPDRCEEFVTRANALHLMFPNFERFPAIDGEKLFEQFPMILDEELLDYVKVMLTDQLWTDNWMITQGKEGIWRAGEIGCLFSHYSVFIKMKNDENLKDDDMVLVMEDDVFMNDDFVLEMEAIGKTLSSLKENVDLLWIAGRNLEHYVPRDASSGEVYEKVADKLYLRKSMNPEYKFDWCRQTTAYLLTKRGARQLMEILRKRYFVKPIDHAMMDSDVKQYDWFPHLGYSPMDYKTDVQGGKEVTPYNVLRLVLFNQYKKVLEMFMGHT